MTQTQHSTLTSWLKKNVGKKNYKAFEVTVGVSLSQTDGLIYNFRLAEWKIAIRILSKDNTVIIFGVSNTCHYGLSKVTQSTCSYTQWCCVQYSII